MWRVRVLALIGLVLGVLGFGGLLLCVFLTVMLVGNTPESRFPFDYMAVLTVIGAIGTAALRVAVRMNAERPNASTAKAWIVSFAFGLIPGAAVIIGCLILSVSSRGW